MKHFGDITKINGSEVPLVDIITGGSPCQDLSVAGKRAGLKHSDKGDDETTRSGLFMEQIRIVKELRNECIRQLRVRGANDDIRLLKPRFMVWENVPGAFSSNKGEDFRCVLEETARIVEKDAIIPRPKKWKTQDVSWETDGQSLIEYMTDNIGVFLKEEKESAWLLTSMENPQEIYCLNCGEKPIDQKETYLSEILEENPDQKYILSTICCRGILKRVERLGGEMPEILKEAMKRQS